MHTPEACSAEDFLTELRQELKRPEHQRLIDAYVGENPLKAMEDEYCLILLEVLEHED